MTTLEVLESQLESLGINRRSVAVVEDHLQRVEKIERERFNEARTSEELAKARLATVTELQDALTEVQLSFDRERENAIDKLDAEQATRRRDKSTLADVVDVEELRTGDDPIELVRLVREAESHSEYLGEMARRLAEKRCRELARADRKLGGGQAFQALCRLSASRRSVTAQDVSERFEHKKRAVTQLITQVAATVGLGEQLGRAVVQAKIFPAPEAGDEKFIIGKYWRDQARRKQQEHQRQGQ